MSTVSEALTSTPASLAQKAYDVIEEMIVTLKLPPGTVFSEQQLSARIGIGRTPLREALQRLVDQQLLVMLPRRGVLVSEIHAGQMLALLETRRVLDRLIAGKAALRATPAQREALRRLADRMQQSASSVDLETYMRLDHQFDRLLEEACRNPFASRAAAPLHTHCRRFWYFYSHGRDVQPAAEHHLALMAAVTEGNGNAAEQASDQLIDYLEALARQALDYR